MTERRRVPCQPQTWTAGSGAICWGMSGWDVLCAWAALLLLLPELPERLLHRERGCENCCCHGRDLHLLRRSVFCLVKLDAALKQPVFRHHTFLYFSNGKGLVGGGGCYFFFFSFSGFWNRFAGGYLFIYLHNSLYMLRMCTFSSWNSIYLLLLDMPSWPELNPFLSAKFSPFKVIPHVKMV